MASKKYMRQFVSGIIDNNPTFVQLLGMCPTLATSTSLENAVGMGLAATAVLAAVERRDIPPAPPRSRRKSALRPMLSSSQALSR